MAGQDYKNLVNPTYLTHKLYNKKLNLIVYVMSFFFNRFFHFSQLIQLIY